MFDMRKVHTRYFKLTLPNGLFLEIEPPRIKTLKKILSLADLEHNETLDLEKLDDFAEGLSLALSKNKQKKTVTAEWIADNLDFDDITDLLTAYFNWVGEVQGSKN